MIGGYRTETLEISADGPPALLCVVIPGNPGVAQFYETFVTRLHAALGGAAHVLAQREQQPAAPAAGRKQRQQETASGGSGAPSVRGGSRSNVALVVSLFPFYAADPSSLKQRQLRWLAQHHRSLRAAAGALALLPGGLKRAAVRLFSRDMDDGPSVEAAASLVHPDAVEQAFYLGKTEFEELAAPADWWLLRALGRRAVVCSAPADTWFPAHHMEEMADEVPGLLHLHLPLTHAFCVSAAQCTRLATELASHIQRAVGREEGEQAAAGAQPSHSKL